MQRFKFHYTHIKYVHALVFGTLVEFNTEFIKIYSFPKVYAVFTLFSPSSPINFPTQRRI